MYVKHPLLTLLAISNHFSWPKYFVLFYQKPWGIWNQGSQFFLKVVEAGEAIFVAKDDVLMMCSFYQKKKKKKKKKFSWEVMYSQQNGSFNFKTIWGKKLKKKKFLVKKKVGWTR